MDTKTRWKRTKHLDLISAEGTFLRLPPPHKNLSLDISASPDAWRTLYIMSFAKPGETVNIIRDLSKAAYDHISAGPGRSVDRNKEDFVNKVRRYAAYVYCWAYHWLKKPEDKWPEPLKEIITKMGKSAYHNNKTRPDPQRVTAFVMEMDFEKEREKYHLRDWTKDPEAFGRTFILNNRYAKFVKTVCKS